MPLERLQKILARAGVSSRRGAEQLILEGRVKVNGRIVSELGFKADADQDHIKVDHHLIHFKKATANYYLCYKPKRTITTMNDPQHRPSINDLMKIRHIKQRVYPVGRLDWDAEGLLILTSDGDLANQIMHPREHIPKLYLVEVLGRPAESTLEKLRKGIFIEPGVKTIAAKLIVLKILTRKTLMKITLFEGRKNQIKRMFERVGHRVVAIKRIAIGPLNLKGMKPGDIRPMTGEEVRRLKKCLSPISS